MSTHLLVRLEVTAINTHGIIDSDSLLGGQPPKQLFVTICPTLFLGGHFTHSLRMSGTCSRSCSPRGRGARRAIKQVRDPQETSL